MLRQKPRRLLEHLVTGRAPLVLIDPLEVVDIDADQRERVAEAGAPPDLLVQTQREIALVEEVGQRVLERQVLELGVADRDGGLGGEGPDQPLVGGVEGHARAALVARVEELEDAHDVALRVLERDDEDRAARGVRVAHVDDLTGLRDVAGGARLREGQGRRLGARRHRSRGKPRLEDLVLDYGEAEVIPVPEEEGAGLGAREPPGLLEDALEEGVEVALAREREADVDETLEALRAVGHGRGLTPKPGSGRAA